MRTPNGLVRLGEISGSGLQGPPGPQGPPLDSSQYYNTLQVDFALAANRPSEGLSDGASTYDSTNNVIRNMLGSGGIICHIFHNPTDPLDSRNGALVVNGDGVSGGSGIDPNVATFGGSAISLKQPTTCTLGLDVQTGLFTDVLQAQQVTTQTFNSNSIHVAGSGHVTGTLSTGNLSTGVVTTSRLTATGDLPYSYSTAGAFVGLVPTVGFASCVLNSSNASKCPNWT